MSSVSTLSFNESFVKIRNALSNGLKICVIMRGLPGRGKTTLAKQIEAFARAQGLSIVLSAADDYMVNADGDYYFDRERLAKAHTLCNKRLVAAMAEGVDIVCQHNTNTQHWESAILRANASELGYIVVFMEPTYAWAPVEEIPAELQETLVSTHGVPEKTISDMAVRKEEIIPRYIAYWLPSSVLLENLDAIPNCIDAFASTILNCFPELSDRPVFDILTKLLHITTDFIGDGRELLEGRIAELQDHFLASLSIRLVAIFADEDLGIGALVAPAPVYPTTTTTNNGGEIDRYEIFTNFAVSRAPTPTVNSNSTALHGLVPGSTQPHVVPTPTAAAHTSTKQHHPSLKRHAPHITLYTRDNKSNSEMGSAAYDFRELLLREESTQSVSSTTQHSFRVTTLGGKYKAIVFDTKDRDFVLPTTYAPDYSDVTVNKMRHFSWAMEDEEEEEAFCDLLARHSKEVRFVETPVPTSILPAPIERVDYSEGKGEGEGGEGDVGKDRESADAGNNSSKRQRSHPHWVLADVGMRAPKGKADDELYDGSDFLRRFLPRGLCYLISPNRVATKALMGLSKFTGDEDEEIASRDEDPDAAAKYFSRPLDKLKHPRVVVTEKANGESAHGTFLRINGVLYVLTGSKGVHMLIRYGVPGDIDLYTGARFSYAAEIARMFLETFADDGDVSNDSSKSSSKSGGIRDLIDRMVAERLTAVFEFEEPAHAHIIPLERRRLKFITFVRSGMHHSTNNGETRRRCSEIAMAPDLALRIVQDAGLDTVWSFRINTNEVAEVKQVILQESTLKLEGCVLYFLDGDEVVGMQKCKNAYYILCRALRERVCGFMNEALKSEEALDPVRTMKHLKNVMKCPAGEKRNAIFESVFQSLYALVQHKVQTALYQSSRRLKGRLEELTVTYIRITNETRLNWVKTGESLMEKLAEDFLASFAATFTPAVNALEEVVCGAQTDLKIDVTDTGIDVSLESFSQGIGSLCDAYFQGHGDRSPGSASAAATAGAASPLPGEGGGGRGGGGDGGEGGGHGHGVGSMMLDVNMVGEAAPPYGDQSGSEKESVVSATSSAYRTTPTAATAATAGAAAATTGTSYPGYLSSIAAAAKVSSELEGMTISSSNDHDPVTTTITTAAAATSRAGGKVAGGGSTSERSNVSSGSSGAADPTTLQINTALKNMWSQFILSAQPFTSEAMRRKWANLWIVFISENGLNDELKIHLRT